jgi:hypothetical protein
MSPSAMCGRLLVGKCFLHACSSGRSSLVFSLLARFTRPLAIMPSADQVPVSCTHSTMRWRKWVVLIAGSTGSALRAVRPFQPSHHAGCPTRSLSRRQCDGFLIALAPCHHRPHHSGDLVGDAISCGHTGNCRVGPRRRRVSAIGQKSFRRVAPNWRQVA